MDIDELKNIESLIEKQEDNLIKSLSGVKVCVNPVLQENDFVVVVGTDLFKKISKFRESNSEAAIEE